MYEGDAPLAERRAAALALDRDLLRDLLGAEELRELLDGDVLADVELELQCLADGRRARSVDELHDVLRRVGDLSLAEIDLRCEGPAPTPDDGERPISSTGRRPPSSTLRPGSGSTRCWRRSGRSRSPSAARFDTPPVRTPPATATRWAARCRSACRWRSPSRSPGRWRNSSAGTPAPTGRSWPPTSPADSVPRTNGSPGRSPPSRRPGASCSASSGPTVCHVSTATSTCCANCVGDRSPRCGARSNRSSSGRSPGSCPPGTTSPPSVGAWRRSSRRSACCREPSLVASTIEADVLPARVRGYSSSMLDELCTAGELVWVGAGGLGARDGRVRLCFADQLAQLAPSWEHRDAPEGRLHDAVRDPSVEQGASFWGQLRGAVKGSSDAELLVALWDLVWAGEVTNDSFAPVRAVLGGASPKPGRPCEPHRRPAPPRSAQSHRPAGGPGPLEPGGTVVVAGADADRSGPRPGVAARRALRRRHSRGGVGRGRGRRVLERVRRVEGARGAGPGAPRLLRRRAGRGAVRGARCRRPAAQRTGEPRSAHPARRHSGADRARRHRPGPALRSVARLAGIARPAGTLGERTGGAACRRTVGLVRPQGPPPGHVPRRRPPIGRGPKRSSRW